MDSGFLKELSSGTLAKMVVEMALLISIQDRLISDLRDSIDSIRNENFNYVDELGALRSEISQLKAGGIGAKVDSIG